MYDQSIVYRNIYYEDTYNLDQPDKLGFFVLIVYKNKYKPHLTKFQSDRNQPPVDYLMDDVMEDGIRAPSQDNIPSNSIRIYFGRQPNKNDFITHDNGNRYRNGNALFYVNIIIVFVILSLILACFIRANYLLCCKRRPQRKTNDQAQFAENNVSMQSENINFKLQDKNLAFKTLNDTMQTR